MKRFLFAVAVVALSACAGLAEQPATGGTATAPAAPVITPAAPAVEYAPAQTQRRGLLARLRNRNNTTNYSTPIMTAPATVAPAAPVPMPGSAPQPMPGTRPTGGTMTAPGKIIQASSTDLPPGIYTATDGTIIQIGGTQSMSMPMTMPMQSQTTRSGLFSRLRNR